MGHAIDSAEPVTSEGGHAATPTSVVHVTQSTEGGVARCVTDLAAYQRRLGWRVTVVSPPRAPLLAWLTAAGVEHRAWAAARRPGPELPAEVRSVARAIRDSRPDVVHLHSFKAGMAGRLALRGRHPTIFQPHAWSFLAVRGPARAGAIAWERLAARWADEIVCVSAAEAVEGRRVGIRAPLTVIPNGVDTDRYRPRDAAARAAARRRLSLGDAPVVVCIGRLSWQKGQDILLDAWPEVQRRIPGAVLALVGEGPLRPLLEGKRAPGVRLAGQSDDVASWLVAADVVAVPSRWDGMALVVLEAMASGRPVVATDVIGAGEALSVPGPESAGALVPPEDPGALAEAIVAHLEDPGLAAREGRVGRRRAEAHFGLDRRLAELTQATVAVLRRRSA